VIESFRHAGLESFYRTGSKAGIQPSHARKLAAQLALLNVAENIEEMDTPGWNLHPLKGTLSGHWSIKVNGNWRMTFRFQNGNAQVIDYQDYH
jgi:proteic killer suppression protein